MIHNKWMYLFVGYVLGKIIGLVQGHAIWGG